MATDEVPYNAADESQVKKKESSNKDWRKQELEDIRQVLNTPAGLRLFRRMMKDAYIFRTTFTGNSNGYFLEGHKNFFLKYFDDICTVCPDKVAKLVLAKDE